MAQHRILPGARQSCLKSTILGGIAVFGIFLSHFLVILKISYLYTNHLKKIRIYQVYQI